MGRRRLIHHRNFAVVFYVFCADLSLFKLVDRKNCFDEIEVIQIILAIKSDTIATDEIHPISENDFTMHYFSIRFSINQIFHMHENCHSTLFFIKGPRTHNGQSN